MGFKERLKQLRSEKNISQNELANAIGVHVTNISRYERGENKPTTEVLTKLANKLGVTTDYLMNGSTEEITNSNLSDKKLLSLFKKVSKLPIEQQKVVTELIEAFVFKIEIQDKLKV